MNSKAPFGLHLYKKNTKQQNALKDLLQLMKSQQKGQPVNFAYVEGENSLIPKLTLWENLQIVSGARTYTELNKLLKPEWSTLLNLLGNPDKAAYQAEPWEKFLVSLIKGILTSGHLLIDMNEDHLSPFMVAHFKKVLMNIAMDKQVYLATAISGLWLDCAHSLITKKEYQFLVEILSEEDLKRHWVA
jgi:ABC-type branched-subunit amino acid transport system ATPase component